MRVSPLQPLGIELLADEPRTKLETVDAGELTARLTERRFAVLRGFDSPSTEAVLAFCRRFGEILEWEFGAVNELKTRSEARNYLYTPGAVPFHWDGAFVGRVPHYIFFHCAEAPPSGRGGETLFCDAVQLLERTGSDLRRQWERIRITYETEKVVHYGGTFTAAMVGRHPVTGKAVLRYAEPVEDLNPVRLSIEGMTGEEQSRFVSHMRTQLYDPAVCYAHAWRKGDIVLADNHALLHGRRAYDPSAPRHLRRVNIL